MNKNFSLLRVSLASPALHLAAPQKNVLNHIAMIEEAAAEGSAILLFPELSLTGATCGQAFLQEQLLDAAEEALISLLGVSAQYPELAIAAGLPLRQGSKLYNAQVLMLGGQFLGAALKHSPGAKGLREGRLFSPGPADSDEVIRLRGHEIPLAASLYDLKWGHDRLRLAILINEDLADPQLYAAAAAEADLLLCPTAQARLVTSAAKQRLMLREKSLSVHTAIALANTSAGESSADEVFGGELLLAEDGCLIAEKSSLYQPEGQMLHSYVDVGCLRYRRRSSSAGRSSEGRFAAPLTLVETDGVELASALPEPNLRPIAAFPFVPQEAAELAERCEEILAIQAAGLARRLRQIRCSQVLLGVSGGLDSTLALLASVRALELLGLGPDHILAVTLPGFGTSTETRSNAADLMDELGVTQKEISIIPAALQHFQDIGHDPAVHDVTYENTQARERTQILMDMANKLGGILVGTGDLSELSLGWCTYNGDHMSMYAINGSVPKSLIRPLLAHEGRRFLAKGNKKMAEVLQRISETPVSPELLPPDPAGKITQKTEEIVGPYTLHDFFLYHMVRRGASPDKMLWLAEQAFGPESSSPEKYTPAEILHWLKFFLKRFFTQQFKRNCAPDGATVGSISYSPRQGYYLPSDADASLWLENL